jgi:glycosyltransferase involved in cell wall biosynthesis
MRIAVVVPFYRERQQWLRQCFSSIGGQRHAVELIAVGDGVERHSEQHSVAVAYEPHRLILLPSAHHDGGRAARAIGALEAITSGFDAVAFLDADNWFAREHIAGLVRLHESTGAPLCTSSLSVVRVDGEPFVPELVHECDGETHADTSTIFVTRDAFPLLLNWALVPAELGSICDRVWWEMAKASGVRRAHSPEKTVFYRNRYALQYRRLGETPPAGTKEFLTPRSGRYSVRVPAMQMHCEIGPAAAGQFPAMVFSGPESERREL